VVPIVVRAGETALTPLLPPLEVELDQDLNSKLRSAAGYARIPPNYVQSASGYLRSAHMEGTSARPPKTFRDLTLYFERLEHVVACRAVLFPVEVEGANRFRRKTSQTSQENRGTPVPVPAPAPAPTPDPIPAIAPFDSARAEAHQQAWADHLGVPVVWTNSQRMEFRLVPPGRFMMGAADEEQAANGDDQPQHPVELSEPFYLGTCEVTEWAFQQFVEASGHPRPQNTTDDPSLDKPAVEISWDDAVAYCRWLSQLEGTEYRLPTEAQWEYACRAGTETRFWLGDEYEVLPAIANLDGLGRPEWDDGWTGVAMIASSPPNPFGFYGMTGNVSEWCGDWYDPGYYGQSPPKNPPGPPEGESKVSRGAGWDWPTAAGDLPATCVFRRKAQPPGWRSPSQGFRVVRSLNTFVRLSSTSILGVYRLDPFEARRGQQGNRPEFTYMAFRQVSEERVRKLEREFAADGTAQPPRELPYLIWKFIRETRSFKLTDPAIRAFRNGKLVDVEALAAQGDLPEFLFLVECSSLPSAEQLAAFRSDAVVLCREVP
jgi:formylglycine-generating enzyme required for sulfatase activity